MICPDCGYDLSADECINRSGAEVAPGPRSAEWEERDALPKFRKGMLARDINNRLYEYQQDGASWGWQRLTIDYSHLTELAAQIREQNQAKGFDFDDSSLDQKLLLVVSEICEAQEALRDGMEPNEIVYEEGKDHGQGPKPEGFPVEIADAIIRLLDICGKYKLDIGEIIREKLVFNKSRPNKHGRKF